MRGFPPVEAWDSAVLAFITPCERKSANNLSISRCALWGTSAGGSYGLAMAAEDKKIACICAQCATLDREFDIYSGDHFEEAVSDQIQFFKTHLGLI